MSYMDTKFCKICDEYYNWAAPECPGCAHRRYSEAQEQKITELRAEVERLRRDRDSYANSNFEGQLSEARAEVERLRAALNDAIELADEAVSYTPAYFSGRWQMDERLAELRKAAIEGDKP